MASAVIDSVATVLVETARAAIAPAGTALAATAPAGRDPAVVAVAPAAAARKAAARASGRGITPRDGGGRHNAAACPRSMSSR